MASELQQHNVKTQDDLSLISISFNLSFALGQPCNGFHKQVE